MGDGDPAVGWETVAERSQWRVGVNGCGEVNWEWSRVMVQGTYGVCRQMSDGFRETSSISSATVDSR